MIERLNLLSQRVDEIAASGRLPDKAIERLAGQIAAIADKLDRAPATPDTDHIFRGIEQRFDMLSDLLDRRQGDAMEHGQAVFRDLERRLDEVARPARRAQLDASRRQRRHHERDRRALRGVGRRSTARLGAACEERASTPSTRVSRNSQRLESRAQAQQRSAIAHLEARLEDISVAARKLQRAGGERRSRHHPQSGIAGVRTVAASCRSRARALPEFEDIGPRLDDIERSLAGNRDSILEAARQAAESAVRSFAGSKSDAAAVSALADDLRSLDELTRRSDERNTKTFEAIHDTLLKIVDRLGSLEEHAAMPAFAELAESAEPARKMALRDAPSIEPDDDMPHDGGRADRGRQPNEMRDVAAGQALAGRSRGRGRRRGARHRRGEPSRQPVAARCSAASRGSFRGKKERAEPAMAQSRSLPGMEAQAPTLDLEQPLDPKLANRPLEPGSGTPDLNAIMRRVRDERGQPAKNSETDAAKSDFIAAARRAAQAAAAEAEIMKRHPDIAGPVRNMKLGDLFSAQAQADPDGRRGDPGRARRAAARQGFPNGRCRNCRQASRSQPPIAEQAAAADAAEADATVAGHDAPAEGAAARRNRQPRPRWTSRTADQPEIEAAPEMAAPADSVAERCPGRNDRDARASTPTTTTASDAGAGATTAPTSDQQPTQPAPRRPPASPQRRKRRRRRPSPWTPCRPMPARCRCAKPPRPATPRRCSKSAPATPKGAASRPT